MTNDGDRRVSTDETTEKTARRRHVAPATPGGDIVVTPESAGWGHLGFEVRTVPAGQRYEHAESGRETCLVVMSGSGVLELDGEEKSFEGRRSVFSGLPHAIYAPPGVSFGVTAGTDLVIGIGSAPAAGRVQQRFIGPGDVKVEMRGGHNVSRQISHVLDPGDAEHLLCVEVYTPSGNWSSYPPHRHDEHVPGVEVDLDEVYHYRIAPQGGFAMQRLYDDARDQDDVVLVRDGDTVLVRRGYHPVVMAPGYDGYYLNFLAGEHATWDARDEPDLAWVRGSWEGGDGRMRLPLGSGHEEGA